VYGRVFNPSGVPITNEFLLPSAWNYGDQRAPRVATDGQGHFVIVWESELVDGNGYAIVARRFDAMGNGLGGEFQVNTTTASDRTSGQSSALSPEPGGMMNRSGLTVESNSSSTSAGPVSTSPSCRGATYA
jgi:hypothetical protein